MSDVEFPYIYHSSCDYEDTLSKAAEIIDRHNIRLLIPGHGTATGERNEMQRRIGESKRYIDGLRSSIAENDDALFDSLIAGCRFPRNMRKFHDLNRKQVEKEMSAANS